MESVKKVMLVLENCEMIELNVEEIDYIDIAPIKRVYVHEGVGNKSELKCAMSIDNFCIRLNKKSERTYKHDFDNWMLPQHLQNRLKQCDIVSIVLVDGDKNEEEYIINWSGDNPNHDEGQFYFTNKGTFIIGSGLDYYKQDFINNWEDFV